MIPSDAKVDDTITLGTVVLVAPAEEVAAGTKLSRVQLRETFWPRDKVPAGAVRNSDEIKEMFAKVNLAANTPISRENLTLTPPSPGIDNLLPEGHRAITIEVDATGGVEGWATPGAHVDLLLTYLDAEDNLTKTRVAVEDAVVLSYNRNMERRGNGETDGAVGRSVSQIATVTLAVPFEDSLKIQTARRIGTIAMILRNLQEVRSRGEAEFTSRDFNTGRKSEKKASKAAIPTGFVKFRDLEGKETSRMLSEGQWYETGGDE
jgi:pilus assembly protein CpaB